MSLTVERTDYPVTRTVVIRPCGRVSVATVGALRECLRSLSRDDGSVVVVDFSGAVLVDQSVLFPLIELTRRMRAYGIPVVVGGASPPVGAKMRIYGLRDRRRRPRPSDSTARRGAGSG